ncbi:hypothetical protein OQA88_13177 [Cercophora sp. LCS_1]
MGQTSDTQEPRLQVPRFLRLSATGDSVSQVHSWLLQLGLGEEAAAPVEVAQQRFGFWTRNAVFAFQTMAAEQEQAPGRTSPPTGVYDLETGISMFDKVRGAGASQPEAYFVVGRVTYAGGSPCSGGTVSLFRRSLRAEKDVQKTVTSAESYFLLRYAMPESERAAAKTGPLALGLQVRLGSAVVFKTPVDQLLLNPEPLALVDVKLTTAAEKAVTFTQIMDVMSHALTDSLEAKLDVGTKEVRDGRVSVGRVMAQLKEDEDSQDMSFLSHLGNLDQSASEQLVNVVASQRLAEFTAAKGAKVPADIVFAVIGGSVLGTIAMRSENGSDRLG